MDGTKRKDAKREAEGMDAKGIGWEVEEAAMFNCAREQQAKGTVWKTTREKEVVRKEPKRSSTRTKRYPEKLIEDERRSNNHPGNGEF